MNGANNKNCPKDKEPAFLVVLSASADDEELVEELILGRELDTLDSEA